MDISKSLCQKRRKCCAKDGREVNKHSSECGTSEVEVANAFAGTLTAKVSLRSTTTVQEFRDMVLKKCSSNSDIKILQKNGEGVLNMAKDAKSTMYDVGFQDVKAVRVVLTPVPDDPCPSCRCKKTLHKGAFERLCVS